MSERRNKSHTQSYLENVENANDYFYDRLLYKGGHKFFQITGDIDESDLDIDEGIMLPKSQGTSEDYTIIEEDYGEEEIELDLTTGGSKSKSDVIDP